MIIKNLTDMKIEAHKIRLGLKGDVYVWNERFIESLSSHRRLFPNSKATTIEEAYEERVAYEAEQERKRREVSENADNVNV